MDAAEDCFSLLMTCQLEEWKTHRTELLGGYSLKHSSLTLMGEEADKC